MEMEAEVYFEYKGNETIENSITVEFCDATIEKLFRNSFDGWCPACCMNKINSDEVICDDCFDKALTFRCQGPPLPDTH